ISETLDDSEATFLATGGTAIASYALATWQRPVTQAYVEQLATHVFFLVMVAAIAWMIARDDRRQQADLAALRDALSVSQERRRLAGDVRDGRGATLTRVILSLEVARRQCAAEPEAASIAEQTTALRGAMEEMRQIVATLRADTAPFDLAASVRAAAAPLAQP